MIHDSVPWVYLSLLENFSLSDLLRAVTEDDVENLQGLCGTCGTQLTTPVLYYNCSVLLGVMNCNWSMLCLIPHTTVLQYSVQVPDISKR